MESVDSTCTDCGRTYSSQKKLEKHGECVHTLLKCDECEQQFEGSKSKVGEESWNPHPPITLHNPTKIEGIWKE